MHMCINKCFAQCWKKAQWHTRFCIKIRITPSRKISWFFTYKETLKKYDGISKHTNDSITTHITGRTYLSNFGQSRQNNNISVMLQYLYKTQWCHRLLPSISGNYWFFYEVLLSSFFNRISPIFVNQFYLIHTDIHHTDTLVQPNQYWTNTTFKQYYTAK